jgi:tetratricopeptide (TPR) repeat protein
MIEAALAQHVQHKAIQHFQRAVEAGPEYAPAYAGLAECLIELAYFFGMDPKKAFAEAKPAALKSVALDEEFAEGHAALGLLRLLDDWDWKAADEETRRAIELAPGNPYVYWKRGVYLRYAGRCDESIAVHLHAESLAPFLIVAILEEALRFTTRADLLRPPNRSKRRSRSSPPGTSFILVSAWCYCSRNDSTKA